MAQLSCYILRPNEDWCYDRFYDEFTSVEHLSLEIAKDPRAADTIWLMSSFCWDRLPYDLLKQKHVVTTVDHIVPEKFSEKQFRHRDTITDVYHIYNEHTRKQIENLTTKPIVTVPYWASQNTFKCDLTREEARAKHNIPQDAWVVFSAQRDTEGSDLISPKLEKGPDLLANAIIKWRDSEHPNVHVLLSSWRRGYIQSRLKSAQVPFTYIELPDTKTLCELYRCADVYPVTSRYEGGPQSLIEAGLLGVPVVSRSIGIAEQVLPAESIADDVTDVIPTVPKIPESWLIPRGFKPYVNMLCNM